MGNLLSEVGREHKNLWFSFPNYSESYDMFILGLQPRDKAAMLVVNTKEIFLLNLHQNRVHFPVKNFC